MEHTEEVTTLWRPHEKILLNFLIIPNLKLSKENFLKMVFERLKFY